MTWWSLARVLDRTVRAAPTRNDDLLYLLYLPFMAVYPGHDELA